jgi:uncharacterized protein
MSTPPDRPLDALGLARGGTVVERNFPIARFARLRDRLAEPAGSAAVRAVFGLRDGLPAAEMEVEAAVVLTCQRCLGLVRRTVQSVARLVFAPEGTPELPPDHEAIGGDPQKLDLAVLVEDELLLSLPLIAQHAPGEHCELPGQAAAAPAGEEPQEKRRPFAGLKDLLKH